ncbi:unnamed protein product [Durusdinium trenchii]
MWGSAKWPPNEKGPNPPDNSTESLAGMRFGAMLVTFVICFAVGFTVAMRTAARDYRSSKLPLHFQA